MLSHVMQYPVTNEMPSNIQCEWNNVEGDEIEDS